MTTATRKRLSLAIVAVCLLSLAILARRSLGIELDPLALRDVVQEVGPAAPIACVLLVAFRALLGIPSQVVLIAAGLCFGTAAGTLYGAIGLTASAIGTFLLARYAGRDALTSRIPARIRPFVEQAGERPGALFVALGTAYPIGFITAYHAIAGVTPMRVATFAIAVAIGSTVRAATYTYFGNSLVADGLTPILLATAVLAAALALPLLFPSARAWLLRVLLARE